MLRHVPLFVVVVLAIVCAGIWSLIFTPNAATVSDIEPAWVAQVFEAAAPADTSVSRVATVLAAQPDILVLPARTQSSGCRVRGPLPDPACSPGAVFADATTSVICISGYTQRVRSVSTSQKKQGYAAYGIAYPPPTGSYEYDHLIPLELGGNNDAANLFPEAATPSPGFKEKDLVEDYLHDEVCAGHLSLPQAQAQIAVDWVAVWSALDPATIKQIRSKYRGWAN